MSLQDVVIVSGVRTAVGSFGGGLKDVAPADLGALVIKDSLARAGVDAGDVQHVVLGQVIQSAPHDMYLARVAAMRAGVPASAPALTLNRLCGSGAQAIISAAQMIKLGEIDVAVAGGAESMSKAPFVLTDMRWGKRMGDAAAVDAMTTALTDPFGNGHMGITAENVAAQCQIGRDAQDQFSIESHRRAAAAINEGRFKQQIVGVEIKTRKGVTVIDTDEHVRPDVTIEDMSKLRPVFREGGTVTAGNASGLNDGAGAVVLMSRGEAERRGLKPLATLVSWGHAGVAPEVMGLGPVHAVPIALKRAGIGVEDLDVVESNEAFAAQACAVTQQLGLDPEKTNVNGGAVALGHPIGATGAIITVKALYELERAKKEHALVTMCIGGGQGIALVLRKEA